jgi:hypothetical protein
MLTVVSESADRDASAAASSVLDGLVREGARRMLAEALQAEVDDYIARFADVRGGIGWWCATAAIGRATCPPALARWK